MRRVTCTVAKSAVGGNRDSVVTCHPLSDTRATRAAVAQAISILRDALHSA